MFFPQLLASASYDDTIKLFAADPYDDEWSCIDTLQSHTATVWSVSFSPCGTYLASAGDDLVIKIWGRDAQDKSRQVGEAGEAVREEGGRMGPWSKGGVRIGAGERWKWSLKTEIKDAHTRTIYSVDWARNGLPKSKGGLGRIVSVGGDGSINVFQMVRARVTVQTDTFFTVSHPQIESQDKATPLKHQLVASVQDAHGVSDVNHAAWCRLSPAKAAATLRSLEGGDGSGAESDDGVRTSAGHTLDQDPRWRGTENMFASAGDDGIVKVWML